MTRRLLTTAMVAGALCAPAAAAAARPTPPPAPLRAVLVHGGYRYSGGATSAGQTVYVASPGDHVHARLALRMPSANTALLAVAAVQAIAGKRQELELELGRELHAPLRITHAQAFGRWVVLAIRKT